MVHCKRCNRPYPRLYIVGSYTCVCGSKENYNPLDQIQNEKEILIRKRQEQELMTYLEMEKKAAKKKKLMRDVGYTIAIMFLLGMIWAVIANTPKVATVPVVEKINPIVRLTNERGTYCTAFVISDQIAITAGHCLYGVPKGTEIEFKSHDKQHTGKAQVFSVRLEGNDVVVRMDQAMIIGDFKKFNHFKLKYPNNGIFGSKGPFKSCGYAEGGNIICYPIKYVGTKYFLITGEGFMYPGMSGGPLFDESTGEVIAVNSRSLGELVAYSPLVNVLEAHGIIK